jgi:hypothetical protein
VRQLLIFHQQSMDILVLILVDFFLELEVIVLEVNTSVVGWGLGLE